MVDLFKFYMEFIISLNVALFITIVFSKFLESFSLTTRTIIVAFINVTFAKYIITYLHEYAINATNYTSQT